MNDLGNHHDVVETSPPRRLESTTLADRVRSLRLPERSVPMRAPAAKLPWLLCLFFAALSGYLAYRSAGAAAADPDKDDDTNAATLASDTSYQNPTGRIALEAGGYIIPIHRTPVSPKVGGQVVKLYIEEGDYVSEGQKIAQIDPAKFEFEFRRKQAIADQAKAKYEKLKAGYRPEERKRAEACLKEAEALHRQLEDEAKRLRMAGAGTSPDEMVKIESKLVQAEHKVEQMRQDYRMQMEGYRVEEREEAKNDWLRAAAERDDAKYDLDNTTVVAPVSGVILAKRAEVGSTVLPNIPSNGLSAFLCDMANLKELEVDVDVSERDLGRVFKGQACELHAEADSSKKYKGEVSRLMPEASRSKASVSVRVRIEVPDNDKLLRPEMRARVFFLNPDKKAS